MMDLKPIRDAVRKRVSALYKERFPVAGQPPVDIEQFEERIERWKRFLKNTNDFESHVAKARKRQAWRSSLRAQAKTICEDITAFNFCAIDVIPTSDETQIMSIGITTLIDGEFKSTHIDIADVRDEPCDFEHGDRITMPLDRALDAVGEALEEAQFVVGHLLANDFGYLSELGQRTYPTIAVLDTTRFHVFLKGRYGTDAPKLSTLLQLYGHIAPVPGVAGNNALSAMELMLTMLEMAA